MITQTFIFKGYITVIYNRNYRCDFHLPHTQKFLCLCLSLLPFFDGVLTLQKPWRISTKDVCLNSHLLKSVGVNMLLNDINQHDTSLKPRYGKGFLWCSVKTMGRSLHAVLGSRKTVGGIWIAGCSHAIVVHQIQLEKLREFITLTCCSFLCVCDSERVKASAWSHRTESVYLDVCFHNDTLWQ